MIMQLPIRRPGLIGRHPRRISRYGAKWWRRRLQDISLVLAFLLFMAVQSALAHAGPVAGAGLATAAIVRTPFDGVKPGMREPRTRNSLDRK